MWLQLLVSVFLVGANAFFVAAEFALVAARAARLEADSDEGDLLSSKALAAVRDIQPRLAGAQLGITMCSLGLGYLAEPAVAALLEPAFDAFLDVPSGVLHSIAFVVALALVTAVHVVAGEMVPKNIAIAAPERSARRLAPILTAYMTVFGPVIWVLNAVSSFIVRRFGMEPVDEITPALNVKEFRRLLADAKEEGVIEPAEHELLEGALEFKAQSAGSLMVPVGDVVSVQRNTPVEDIEVVVAESGHTRVPVWETGPADLVGFFHAKDLLRLPVAAHQRPVPDKHLRLMLVVSPTTAAREAMRQMRELRVHIAVVRRAGGAVLGILTLEDVLESLVGEIYDETDDA